MKKIKDLFKKYYVYITYIISAGISFFLDLALFSLFLWVFDGFSAAIILASYTARALSSFINYLINKYKVFRYKKREDKKDNTVWQYFGLVVINITLSAIIVDTVVNFIPIYATIIKFFVDILIFVVNFFIQKKFIFNENKTEVKLVKYVLPVISFIAMYIKLNDKGISFDYEIYEIIAMVIVLPILYLLYLRIFKKGNYKSINILSLIFTLLMILGYSYDTNYTPNLVLNSNIHILVTVIKFIGFYFFFKYLLNIIYYYIVDGVFKEKTNKIKNMFLKHPFLFSFIDNLWYIFNYLLSRGNKL